MPSPASAWAITARTSLGKAASRWASAAWPWCHGRPWSAASCSRQLLNRPTDCCMPQLACCVSKNAAQCWLIWCVTMSAHDTPGRGGAPASRRSVMRGRRCSSWVRASGASSAATAASTCCATLAATAPSPAARAAAACRCCFCKWPACHCAANQLRGMVRRVPPSVSSAAAACAMGLSTQPQ